MKVSGVEVGIWLGGKAGVVGSMGRFARLGRPPMAKPLPSGMPCMTTTSLVNS